MNAQERELFWQTLVSLPGEDIQAESQRLNGTIKFPKYLYRYRPVSKCATEKIRCRKARLLHRQRMHHQEQIGFPYCRGSLLPSY